MADVGDKLRPRRQRLFRFPACLAEAVALADRQEQQQRHAPYYIAPPLFPRAARHQQFQEILLICYLHAEGFADARHRPVERHPDDLSLESVGDRFQARSRTDSVSQVQLGEPGDGELISYRGALGQYG